MKNRVPDVQKETPSFVPGPLQLQNRNSSEYLTVDCVLCVCVRPCIKSASARINVTTFCKGGKRTKHIFPFIFDTIYGGVESAERSFHQWMGLLRRETLMVLKQWWIKGLTILSSWHCILYLTRSPSILGHPYYSALRPIHQHLFQLPQWHNILSNVVPMGDACRRTKGRGGDLESKNK